MQQIEALNSPYAELASDASIERTATRLSENGMTAHVVETAAEAHHLALELIPDGAEVFTAASQTLEAIGLNTAIESSPRLKAVRNVLAGMDMTTQFDEMRALGARPQVIVGSVQAVTEQGQAVIVSASGSQIGPYVSGAGKVIWIVGSQKIVPTLDDAMRRVDEYVFPLENARAQAAYGQSSFIGKVLTFHREYLPDRVSVILVKEQLGY